ncbi:MAG TPA: CAP domain-containing protein [Puia sp.]
MRGIISGLILCFSLGVVFAGPPQNFVKASSLALPRSFPSLRSGMSSEILKYVNEYRHSKGLKALQANSFISSVALGHSRDMLSGKTPFGHEGFRGRIDRIKKRLGPIHVAAENVASGPMGAREVVDGWLHSPGHRRNIEGDFRLTGIGLAYGKRGMIYFTQIFTK